LKRKTLSLLALFIALSVVGASIKIPAIVGSVALDAFPALLAAALLGGGAGALVAGGGHLVSALLGGLPLGPLHIVVAIEMSLLVFIFSRLYHRGRNKYTAAISFVIGNALLAPLPFLFLMGVGFYTAIVPSLMIGSVINVIVSILLIPKLEPFFASSLSERIAKL